MTFVVEDFSLWRSKYTFPKFQIFIILLFCVSDGLLWRQPWLNADQNWVSPKPFSSSVVMLRTLKHGSVKSYRQCWMNLTRIQPTYRYFFCHQLMSLWTGCHFCCNTSDLAFGFEPASEVGVRKVCRSTEMSATPTHHRPLAPRGLVTRISRVSRSCRSVRWLNISSTDYPPSLVL